MNNLDGLAICKNCLKDPHLIKLIFLNNCTKKKCISCKKIRICANYLDLAQELEKVILEYYIKEEHDVRHRWNKNYYLYGDSLETVAYTILNQDIPKLDSIIDYLCWKDEPDSDDSEIPFFSHDEQYVEKKINGYVFENNWNILINELKSKRRFFSDNARKLLTEIFKDVDNLYTHEYFQSSDKSGNCQKKEPVIRLITINDEIYRARRADSQEQCKDYVNHPERELSPPPSKFAQQGRMNAKGVSIFYGALEAETCIAEIRPSIGCYVVVGTFIPNRELKILDFRRLESSITEISYFQHDAQYQWGRKKFLNKLHKLISTPVISGHEDEYLMTQVLAEYLAYVRENNFDGISFESSQFQGGTNIILFPKNEVLKSMNFYEDDFYEDYSDQPVLQKYSIKFKVNSEKVLKIHKIKYETSKEDTADFKK